MSSVVQSHAHAFICLVARSQKVVPDYSLPCCMHSHAPCSDHFRPCGIARNTIIRPFKQRCISNMAVTRGVARANDKRAKIPERAFVFFVSVRGLFWIRSRIKVA